MSKKYIVTLTKEEQQQLKECISKGKNSARTIRRANILLSADEGLKNEEIVSRVKCGLATVSRTKQRYIEGGLDRALVDNSPYARIEVNKWMLLIYSSLKNARSI